MSKEVEGIVGSRRVQGAGSALTSVALRAPSVRVDPCSVIGCPPRPRLVRIRRFPLPTAATSGACKRSYRAKRYSTRSRSDAKRGRR